jgi:GNAT superfamily N-acetyltransferase
MSYTINPQPVQTILDAVTPAPAEFLTWDSDFFDFRIGRVQSHPFDPDAVENWRRANQIRCLYYLAEINDIASIHAAESLGFRLMDIRTSFFLSLPSPACEPSKYLIRQAQRADFPHLLPISTHVFCNSRFYQDSNFPPERVDAMYNLWLENHFDHPDTCVWIVEEAGQILGFTSIETHPQGIARLSLTGVHPSARRRGLASALKSHIINYYSSAGYSGLESITQGRNRSLINLNYDFGFKLINQQMWFHAWFADKP